MKCRINLERRARFHNTDLYFIPVTCEIIASLAGIQKKREGNGDKVNTNTLKQVSLGRKVCSFFPMCMCPCVAWAGVHRFSFQVVK